MDPDPQICQTLQTLDTDLDPHEMVADSKPCPEHLIKSAGENNTDHFRARGAGGEAEGRNEEEEAGSINIVGVGPDLPAGQQPRYGTTLSH